jgi:DNA-binding PadR family transcriptional regulator
MLELAILGLLKERSMHGYQLSKRLSDALGGFWRVSYGSLYPTIRRLEQEAAVERVFDDQQVGRRKNVYRITDRGEELFLELLEEAGGESASEENPFRVRLAFFKYLAPDTRIRVLERRRAFLEERRSAIRTSLAGIRDGNDTYALALMEHGLDATESDIAWLEGLIAAERRQAATTRTVTRETKRATKRRSARTLRRKERTT